VAAGVSGPPRLWLKCGLCGKCPNLAALTPAGPPVYPPTPRLARAVPLPGDDYVLRERPGVTGAMIRPGRAGEGFTITLTCPACARPHQVRQERLARWWQEFLATRRNRDEIYLGRDQ
jgi:hypothetical protein